MPGDAQFGWLSSQTIIHIKPGDLFRELGRQRILNYVTPLGSPPALRSAVWCWQFLPRRFFYPPPCYIAQLVPPQPRVCVRVDCDTGVTFVPVPFPLQGEALGLRFWWGDKIHCC